MPTKLPAPRVLMLMLPILLVNGCAFDSQPPSVVEPPAIPALPLQAYQPIPPLLCRLGCSKGFEALENSLQATPTSSGSVSTPASAATAR